MEYTILSSPLVANGVVYIGGNFVSTKSPDYESSGAVIALKSSVESLQFIPPSSAMTSTTSTDQTQYPLNLVLIASLVIIVIAITVTAVLLLRRGKKTSSTQSLPNMDSNSN
jgi:hypothetical protein